MTELDDVERTLQLAYAELSPSPLDKARARSALRLPPAPSEGSEPRRSNDTRRSWSALRASGSAGVLVGALLIGAGFAVGYAVRPQEAPAGDGLLIQPPLTPPAHPPPGEPLRVVARAPEPEPARPSSESPPAPRFKTRNTKGPHTPATRSPAPSREQALESAAPSSSPVDELSLLRRVERALRADDPAMALALIGELDERFPQTDLGEERRAASVMAHCGLGNPGARLRAESFLREREGSVYGDRVRAACATPNPAAQGNGEGSGPSGDQ